MNRRIGGSIAVGTLVGWLGAGPIQSAAAAPQTFEGLAESATRVTELGAVLLPLMDDCSKTRRDIDKARCLGVRAYMRKRLPELSFVAAADDPQVLSVSDYDARVKGFRLRIAGCLACKAPIVAGGEKRFVTLKAPPKGATSLAAAVGVSEAAISFNDIAESAAWNRTVKPHLRTEFIFKPTDAEWTLGSGRGYAFKLLGARVFDRCTGEVVFSQPESASAASKSPDATCPGPGGGAQVSAPGVDDLPEQLDASAINAALAAIRPDTNACFEMFRMKGTAFLIFDVPGGGGNHNVTLEGTLGGTAMGLCVMEAARKAQFPRFRIDHQKFRYPVVFPVR